MWLRHCRSLYVISPHTKIVTVQPLTYIEYTDKPQHTARALCKTRLVGSARDAGPGHACGPGRRQGCMRDRCGGPANVVQPASTTCRPYPERINNLCDSFRVWPGPHLTTGPKPVLSVYVELYMFGPIEVSYLKFQDTWHAQARIRSRLEYIRRAVLACCIIRRPSGQNVMNP